MAFEPAEIARFTSPEAEQRFLAAYAALRDELLPPGRTERMVETDAGSTFVVSYGATGDAAGATPLVMLAGHAATTAFWHDYVAALDGVRPMHLVDNIGDIGAGVPRAGLKTPADTVRWLEQTLDGLEVERAHVAGVSQGGWVALQLAVHAPGRVASLTLSEPGGLEPVGMPRFIARSFAMVGAFFLPGFLGRGVAALLHTGIRDAPRNQMRLLVMAMRTHRSSLPPPPALTDDELRSITQPTYLQLASHSEILRAERVKLRVEALLPGVRVDIIPKSSHSVGYDRPGTMIANLRALDDASIAT
jgi:pimeloyl-ACP methyl ester carboxylesterase